MSEQPMKLPVFPLQCECNHFRRSHDALASNPVQYGRCWGKDEWGNPCDCMKFKLKKEVLP